MATWDAASIWPECGQNVLSDTETVRPQPLKKLLEDLADHPAHAWFFADWVDALKGHEW
jgi:hypothetical protein